MTERTDHATTELPPDSFAVPFIFTASVFSLVPRTDSRISVYVTEKSGTKGRKKEAKLNSRFPTRFKFPLAVFALSKNGACTKGQRGSGRVGSFVGIAHLNRLFKSVLY